MVDWYKDKVEIGRMHMAIVLKITKCHLLLYNDLAKAYA
jgi:hypothetical protein